MRSRFLSPTSGGANTHVGGYGVGMPTVSVFSPDPLVTVTVEAGADGDEIHLHAGGQGFWVARMVAALDVSAWLCAPFGGEPGRVALTLSEAAGLEVRGVPTSGANGCYVHDRRHGERETVAETPPAPLTRHEVDELYGAALVAGLESDVTVLAGPGPWDPPPVPADIYRRLASDLRANGRLVVADLSGETLRAALEGGVTVLKVSHEDLGLGGADPAGLIAALHDLQRAGAEHVLLTRAEEPALALFGDDLLEVVPPRVEPVDHRGAGDSMTGGLAAGLARALDLPAALRLGAAAAALNVTRRGLASGHRDEIEPLAERIELRRLAASTALRQSRS